LSGELIQTTTLEVVILDIKGENNG
jgi:hypothetical protein